MFYWWIFKWFPYLKFHNKFSKKYNIDFYKIDKKYEVIDINKNNTNEKETNKKETNKKEYIYDIPSQLINIIDPQYKVICIKS